MMWWILFVLMTVIDYQFYNQPDSWVHDHWLVVKCCRKVPPNSQLYLYCLFVNVRMWSSIKHSVVNNKEVCLMEIEFTPTYHTSCISRLKVVTVNALWQMSYIILYHDKQPNNYLFTWYGSPLSHKMKSNASNKKTRGNGQKCLWYSCKWTLIWNRLL